MGCQDRTTSPDFIPTSLRIPVFFAMDSNPHSNNLPKQACDGCRRRKVKCISPRPCKQCRAAGLVCRTSIQRQRKGRQGQTANILSELRSKEIERTLPSGSSASPSTPLVPQSPKPQGRSYFSRTPDLLGLELINACSDYFFSRMRGTVPILQPNGFQKQVDTVDASLHAYCFVTAFCAFVVTQTGFGVEQSSRPNGALFSEDDRSRLVDEATEARKHLDPFTDPVRQNIIIAFLLYGCHIGLGNQRHAYYFLREATTLYTASALESQATSAQADDADPSLAGNLFWLLLVSERAHAIRRHRPITLQVTSQSPQLEDNPNPEPSAIGFRCLANLYLPFDEVFLSHWNGNHTTCSVESLVVLEERIQIAVPPELDLPDVIMADLRVSQQWLRIMIWQLSTTAGFLSTNPSHECMDFRYPLLIAQDLCLATWKLSRQSMETHGIGLIEKIFEVACTLVDVMACLSAAGLRSSGFKLGPQDYLKHFSSLIHDLPGGRRRFLPLLFTKIGQTLPSMIDSITIHLNLPPNPILSSTTNAQSTSMLAEKEAPSESSTVLVANPASDDWADENFNYAEMSRIGDKTPEIHEAFLQYSTYFP
ncbi:uncharacterized protein N7511_006046 [Penicillium nucicola]|uniref:uncharacterized protein n=1 Tax=Penicillium nucicola TaxID=1850975 RepID=UPI002544E8A0|nr:uncharacterized protein N7511_006046 [Penicillium nucicola]KAJ5757352.1 hypothetical protein N7511_006046 [Penicillium nucicola]